MVTRLVIVCFALYFFSCGRKNKKEVIYTDLAPKPIGPYSQAIRSGGTLFISGQIALSADGSYDTSSIEIETKQVLQNIKAIVEAGGMSMGDVSKTTIYLKDLKNFAKMNEVYKSFFSAEPPARETIEVKDLPKGAHVEISAIAK